MIFLYKLLAFSIPLFASFSYIKEINNGNVRPERATRLMYVLLLTVSFVQQLQLESGSGAILLNLSELIVCIVVGFVAIKNGKGGFSNVDKACYLILVFSLVVWLILGKTLGGLILICIADFAATLPTIIAIYNKPKDEVAWFWFAGSCGAFFALLASGDISINQVFIIYIMLINLIVGLMVILIPSTKKNGGVLLK
jgi:hypothetical protein